MDLWPPMPLPNLEAAFRDVTSRHPVFRMRAALSLGDLHDRDDLRGRAVEALRGLLRDASSEVRAAAATSLGGLRSVDAVEDLIRLAEDPDPVVASEAIAALGQIEDPRGADAVRRACGHASPGVRLQAASLIGGLSPDSARECLGEAIRDKDPDVRSAAAVALADLGDPSAAGLLKPVLEDPDPGVAFDAAACLARLGLSDGAVVLRRSLEDRRLAPDAAIHLGLLKDRASLPELQRTYRRLLFPKAGRIHAAAAAAVLGDPEALRFVQERLGRKGMDGHLSRAVVGTLQLATFLEPLGEPLASADAEIAESALAALLGFDPPAVRDLLRRTIPRIRAAEVREEAERILSEGADLS